MRATVVGGRTYGLTVVRNEYEKAFLVVISLITTCSLQINCNFDVYVLSKKNKIYKQRIKILTKNERKRNKKGRKEPKRCEKDEKRRKRRKEMKKTKRGEKDEKRRKEPKRTKKKRTKKKRVE